MFTLRRSLILAWCCTITSLLLMSRGGWFVLAGHVPVACIIFLRRHVRKIGNVPPLPKQKRIMMIALIVLTVFSGIACFGFGVAYARIAFYGFLAMILGTRLFEDSKVFVGSLIRESEEKANQT